MIRAKNVKKLIDNFERVLPYAQYEYSLDMNETSVSSEYAGHHCGTSHCHAGWYLLAKKWDLKSRFLESHRSYQGGVVEMEKDLRCNNIRDWAKKNPLLWGNNYGGNMFIEKRAFGDNCKTLEDIVVHWIGVYANVLAEEEWDSDRND